MPQDFDPYFEWLGIAPKHQPPNHYRLLNLDAFEQDVPLIAAAAQRVTARLHDVPPGTHDAESRRVLKEVMAAGSCLLDESAKAAYDKKLRAMASGGSRKPAVQEDAVKDVDLQLEPIAPQVREVRQVEAVAMPPVESAGSFGGRSSAPAQRRPRNKQNPVVMTALLLLFVVIAGITLYYVVIAPPGDDSNQIADTTGDDSKRNRKKKSASKERPPAKITLREGPKTKADTSRPVDDGPPLDAIDDIGEHPPTKPSPFGALPEWDDSPDGPDDQPLKSDDDDDDDTPDDPEAAEELWKEAKSLVDQGDVDNAIPALEKYILHAGAKQHRQEADGLLKEARVAVPDEAMIAAIFEQLSAQQLDSLEQRRLTVHPGLELTNPTLSDVFHKALRAKVPEEKRRRAEAAKKAGGDAP